MSTGPVVPVADADDVRPTPVSKRLLDDINERLAGIPDQSISAAIVQIPEGRVLRGALYVNIGHGLSFATWLDHDLEHKAEFGYGIAVRKTFGSGG